MKATGIVRRIDDLGRVEIPKEIRRTMRIREGDPLEIFTDNDGEVVFKKYSPIGELSPFAGQYADVMSRACGMAVLICDRDHVVAAAGVSKKEFQEYFGTAIENIYGEVLKKYKKQGLLLEESGRIFLSREGIHVSNAVMADFLL